MQRIMTWVVLGALLSLGIGCDSGGAGETSMDTGACVDAVAGSDTTTPGCEPTDPCCDADGAFLPAGETCVLSEESVCSNDGCGGAGLAFDAAVGSVHGTTTKPEGGGEQTQGKTEQDPGGPVQQ